jgi:signal transduction histidine kinase
VTRALSFRARLTLRLTLLFSLLLAVAGIGIFVGLRSIFFEYLDAQLRTLAATEVTSAVDSPESRPHVHELPVRAFAGAPFARKLVQVFDTTGALVTRSQGADATAFVEQQLIAAAMAGQSPLKTIDIDGAPYRVVVLRVIADGQPYAIAVAVGVSEIVTRLHRIRWLLAFIWLVSSGAMAAVGFALASTALQPVRRMTDRALAIARGDLNARLEPSPLDDEIGRMTQALNALIERLHAALNANRQFAADAAHELRGPVTAIAGEVEVALRRPRTEGEYRETLTVIQTRVAALAALINDLILVVRAQEGNAVEIREVPVSRVLQDAVAQITPLARARQVTIETVQPERLIVYAEERLLARAIENVLENGVRYNREGGKVVVSTALTPAGAAWPPGFVTVRVSDTGIGIPEPDRERIFDRFYRVDDGARSRDTGGSGLGLPIAREVLALFKGTIRIEQSTTHGTVVAIELPGKAAGVTTSMAGVNDSV